MEIKVKELEAFVEGCTSCSPADTQQVRELLEYGAALGKSILDKRREREKIPYEDIVQLYNDICVSLPRVYKLSEERKRHIKACFAREGTLEDFERAFRTVQKTPFLRGENERGWHATFDWLIKPQNLLKVLENNYGTAQGSDPSYDLDELFDKAMNTTPTLKKE